MDRLGELLVAQAAAADALASEVMSVRRDAQGSAARIVGLSQELLAAAHRADAAEADAVRARADAAAARQAAAALGAQVAVQVKEAESAAADAADLTERLTAAEVSAGGSDAWKALLDKAVAGANEVSHSRASRVQKWVVLERDLSEEEGELTPTLKVKRKNVVKNFEYVIERLYG